MERLGSSTFYLRRRQQEEEEITYMFVCRSFISTDDGCIAINILSI